MNGGDTRNFIVTGAAGGMGSAATRQLLERGHHVLAVDLNADVLEELANKLNGSSGQLEVFAADVSEDDDAQAYVAAAVNRFGGLDGIFNIAGVGTGEYKVLAEVSNATYDRVMKINARSAWLGMKYTIPHLIARGGGAIVNTGSHLAWHAAPTFSAYVASKHAVIGMSKAAALEYGRNNIRVNVVCPSAMETAMGEEAAHGIDPDDPRVGWQVMIDQSANGRVARPDEAAAAGVWLLLDAPEHISGIIVPVDGAQSAK